MRPVLPRISRCICGGGEQALMIGAFYTWISCTCGIKGSERKSTLGAIESYNSKMEALGITERNETRIKVRPLA